jgi:hypothetical protein
MQASYHGERTPHPGDGLLHPVPLLAIGLLLLNDHLLKASYPTALTGKLSDLAGLMFFPSMLEAVYEQLCFRRSGLRPSARRTLGFACLTGAVFAAVELWPVAAQVYRYGLAALQWPVRALLTGWLPLVPVAHVADAEDLWALPALAVPVLLGIKRARPRERSQGVL